MVLEMVSGGSRWQGGGLTCLCTPNDNNVVVIVLLSTAGAYGGKVEIPGVVLEMVSGEGRWRAYLLAGPK